MKSFVDECVCVFVRARARLTKLVYSACDRIEQNNRLNLYKPTALD